MMGLVVDVRSIPKMEYRWIFDFGGVNIADE